MPAVPLRYLSHGPCYAGIRRWTFDLNDANYAEVMIRAWGNPGDGYSVTIEDETYTFVDSLTDAWDVLIGTSAADSVRNLGDAIRYANYSTKHLAPNASSYVHCAKTPDGGGTAVVDDMICVSALAAGAGGESVLLSTDNDMIHFAALAYGPSLGRMATLDLPDYNNWGEDAYNPDNLLGSGPGTTRNGYKFPNYVADPTNKLYFSAQIIADARVGGVFKKGVKVAELIPNEVYSTFKSYDDTWYSWKFEIAGLYNGYAALVYEATADAEDWPIGSFYKWQTSAMPDRIPANLIVTNANWSVPTTLTPAQALASCFPQLANW